MRFASALLATALPLLANGQAQLLPAGEFAARDGRPGKNLKWKVTNGTGAQLAAQLNVLAETNPIVIDYEHQTMLSGDNGKPAPAAGWITSVEWKDGVGLFAEVDWTDTAKQHINAKEYRFISPVIDYSRQTGEITGLHNAALTNFPALTGMKPVVAQLSAQFSSHDDHEDEEPQVDLSALLTQLGLPPNTSAEVLAAHINGLKTTSDQVAQLRSTLGLAADASLTDVGTAVAGLKAKLGLTDAATLGEIGSTVASLKASAGTPDQATLAAMSALQSEVAQLKTAALTREVGELVEAAIGEHKLLPSQREWGLEPRQQRRVAAALLPRHGGAGARPGRPKRRQGPRRRRRHGGALGHAERRAEAVRHLERAVRQGRQGRDLTLLSPAQVIFDHLNPIHRSKR